MLMRARGEPVFSSATLRKEPIVEITILADITEKIRNGSLADKLGAIADLSIKMDEGKAPFRESIEILGEALRDDAKWVKWNAVLVLAKHGSEVLPGLCNGLGNDDPRIRGMSAAMINCVVTNNTKVLKAGTKDDVQMVSQLFASLSDELTGVRETAFATLLEISKRNPIIVLARSTSEVDNTELRLLYYVQTINVVAIDSLSAQSRRNLC